MYQSIFEKIKKIPLIRFFSVSVLLSFILWLIFLYNGDSNQAIIFWGGKGPCGDIFMDFINPLRWSDNFLIYDYLPNYRRYMCYPPCVYFFFNFLNTLATNINSVELYFSRLFVAVVCLLFISALLVILNYYNLSNIKKGDKFLFSLAILCSGVYLHSLDRGNISIGIMLCLYFFVFNYRSKNKLLKEFAIFLLAVSSIFKLGPTIFISLLFIQKDYKGIFRFFIYLTSLLILPCLAYPRGIECILSFLDNLHLSCAYNIIPGQGKLYISQLLMKYTGLNFDTTDILINFIFLSIAAFCIIFLKQEWKRVLVLAFLVISIPKIGSVYTLVYLIPAIVAYSNDEKKSKFDYLFLLWFFMIFNTFQIQIGAFNSEKLKEIGLLALYLQLFIESIKAFDFEQIKSCINTKINLLKFFLRNKKQKNLFDKKTTRYTICCILSLIIATAGSFAYYKNYTYDRYKAENIKGIYSFEQKHTILGNDYKIDLECIFIPHYTNGFETIFATTDNNTGIKLEMAPDMKSVISFINQNNEPKDILTISTQTGKIYKVHAVLTEKSVSAIFLQYSPRDKNWIEVYSNIFADRPNERSFQRITAGGNFSNENCFTGKILSFDLKIQNGSNSNWIVILTLFLFFLPLIYAFYYKDFRKLLHLKCF